MISFPQPSLALTLFPPSNTVKKEKSEITELAHEAVRIKEKIR